MEHRVLIYAPIGKDAQLVSKALARANLECFICAHNREIFTEIEKGVGALFIGDEALTADFLKGISGFLRAQPAWSDLPIIVLSQGLDRPATQVVYPKLGNVTLLERPVRIATLVSATLSVMRARRRQYDMREIDRRKDEFLAMLAHELRNPLAPISAAADLLQVMPLDERRVKETSEIIARQVRHMTGLVDDLMDASRVTQGLVSLEVLPLDVKKIVSDAIEQVRPLIEARRHQLAVHISPQAAFVEGDQKRLIQVLSNLLNNAAKYTPEGGSIVLRLEVSTDCVTLRVADNGVGMAPPLIPRAFDMFAQGERTPDRSQGGLGIGLALVKSLVELHRGGVSAQSKGPNEGTEFTVWLPRMPMSDLPSTKFDDSIRDKPHKPLRVMVVDDNRDAALMLSMCLEAAGHVVTVEHTSKGALERARTEMPDVCLLDIGLPDMDGYALARLLRSQRETAATVLIAITGYGQAQDRKSSAEAGFAHHFVKPVDTVKLGALLGELAKNR